MSAAEARGLVDTEVSVVVEDKIESVRMVVESAIMRKAETKFLAGQGALASMRSAAGQPVLGADVFNQVVWPRVRDGWVVSDLYPYFAVMLSADTGSVMQKDERLGVPDAELAEGLRLVFSSRDEKAFDGVEDGQVLSACRGLLAEAWSQERPRSEYKNWPRGITSRLDEITRQHDARYGRLMV